LLTVAVETLQYSAMSRIVSICSTPAVFIQLNRLSNHSMGVQGCQDFLAHFNRISLSFI